jgi:hypothetical protein
MVGESCATRICRTIPPPRDSYGICQQPFSCSGQQLSFARLTSSPPPSASSRAYRSNLAGNPKYCSGTRNVRSNGEGPVIAPASLHNVAEFAVSATCSGLFALLLACQLFSIVVVVVLPGWKRKELAWMAGLTVYLGLTSYIILFNLVLSQAPKDPVRSFCRRFSHQTAVIDRQLYIDGGYVNANPLSQNPRPVASKACRLCHQIDGSN